MATINLTPSFLCVVSGSPHLLVFLGYLVDSLQCCWMTRAIVHVYTCTGKTGYLIYPLPALRPSQRWETFGFVISLSFHVELPNVNARDVSPSFEIMQL